MSDKPVSFKETLPAWLVGLADGAELTIWPLIAGVATCAGAGYWIGAEYFSGTWVPSMLAVAGGALGILLGVVLAGMAVGAVVGAAVGAAMWYPTRGLLHAQIDQLFWWPIYLGGALGGLAGCVIAIVSSVNTVRWWQQRRT